MGALIALITVGSTASGATAELAFFETTKDARIATQDPDQYEKVDQPPVGAGGPTYVDRLTPKLVVRDTEIIAITIEDRPPTATVEEVKRQFAQQREGTGPAYYQVAFALTMPAAERARKFLTEHEQVPLGLRFGTRTLGVVVPCGSFDGDTFTTFILTLSRTDLEAAFSSMKERVHWK